MRREDLTVDLFSQCQQGIKAVAARWRMGVARSTHVDKIVWAERRVVTTIITKGEVFPRLFGWRRRAGRTTMASWTLEISDMSYKALLSMDSRARPPDLARCSHGRDLGDMCPRCTSEGLAVVALQHVAATRCKGCGHPVGPLVNYCGECAAEDETDCW
jgi:hypothetical protein